MEPAVRGARVESAIVRPSRTTFLSRSAIFPKLPSDFGRRNPAAGNGIFRCRDRGPKSGLETAKCRQRPAERNDTGKNPRRTGLFLCGSKNCGLAGLDGGRDRDRTCDPLDVNEVLSLVSPSARPKNRRRSAAYAAYDFVESYAIDRKMEPSGTRLGPQRACLWDRIGALSEPIILILSVQLKVQKLLGLGAVEIIAAA
jgi:hypothetical protein